MKTLIERLEAALGDAHDPVKVALTAGDVRALIAAHKAATAKAEGMEDVLVAKMAERDAAEAKLKALHEAAQALVAELESTSGDWPRLCDAPRCRRLATSEDGDQIACDEHQGELVAGDIEDLSYAPALRQLRALLEGGSR